MARNKQLVWITPVHFDHQGRPVDPDYGVDSGEHPGQGLPGGWGGRPPGPDQGLPGGGWGRPPHPGQGLPGGGFGGGWGHPDQGLPGEGGSAGQLPVYPIDPEHPDQGLPPEVPPGLPELPPGTIWPPLPPNAGIPAGKALAVVYISGVGSRWAVIDIPERPVDPDYGVDGEEGPDQGLPPNQGRPPRPDQGLPGRPDRPSQGLPPTGRPPAPGQGLPRPPGAPPRPGHLPAPPTTAQPKR